MSINQFNEPIDDEVIRINSLFQIAVAANQSSREYRKFCEEFFYNDVEKTRTQFDQKQNKEISNTYNIPVSTKFTYAVVEQLVSFLTATKPYAKLVAVNDQQQEFVFAYQNAYHATMYESQVPDKIKNQVRDGFTSGEGWLLVRRPNYLGESTTNVIIDYRPWKHIIIDPESRDENYEDARYFFDIDLVERKVAEERYDVIIGDDNLTSIFPNDVFGDLANDFYPFGVNLDKNKDKLQYVWIRNFYERKEKNVYIGNNPSENIYGIVSVKRPKSISIANPEKMQLSVMLIQMSDKLDELQSQLAQSLNNEVQAGSANINNAGNLQDFTLNAGVEKSSADINTELQQKYGQLQQEYQQLQIQYSEMPDSIPAYEMKIEKLNELKEKVEQTVIVTDLLKHRKRVLQRTFLVGNEKLDTEISPGDTVPLIPLNFCHFNSPNRVFGTIHFILDVVMAMNKYVADIMFDISVNGHRRGFIWDGTIVDPANFENDMARPDSFVKLKANPSLKDNGAPIVIEPSPLNQSISYMLDYFKQLVEYITGIYGVIQGNSNDAPTTMGATTSLQSFGTQRVKLYARRLETSLERLAYVTVSFLQKYCPRDTVLKYFDANGDAQEAKIMDNAEDLKFKVRVDITSTLPTQRLLVQQALMFIAQTAGDPTLSQLLLKYYLKVADVPEALEIANEIDVVKQLQSALAQVQEQMKILQANNTNLTNMMAQKDMGIKVKEATQAAEQNIAVAQQKAIDNSQMQNDEQLPEVMQ